MGSQYRRGVKRRLVELLIETDPINCASIAWSVHAHAVAPVNHSPTPESFQGYKNRLEDMLCCMT